MRYPFNGTYPVTRPFGGKPDPVYANYPGSTHPGTDYAVPANTPLLAAMDGTVTVCDRPKDLKTGRGKEVSIAQGVLDVNTCHMNQITVNNGQFVREGQQIGLSGNTGYVLPAPTPAKPNAGAHLHFEVLENGKYVDPETKFKEADMPSLTATEIDEFISQAYQKIAGRPPADKEFVFHRKNFASYGPVWALRMVEGFKGDDVAWKKYERNLKDAGKTACTPEERAFLDLRKKI